jgi:hypothetical protein
MQTFMYVFLDLNFFVSFVLFVQDSLTQRPRTHARVNFVVIKAGLIYQTKRNIVYISQIGPSMQG